MHGPNTNPIFCFVCAGMCSDGVTSFWYLFLVPFIFYCTYDATSLSGVGHDGSAAGVTSYYRSRGLADALDDKIHAIGRRVRVHNEITGHQHNVHERIQKI